MGGLNVSLPRAQRVPCLQTLRKDGDASWLTAVPPRGALRPAPGSTQLGPYQSLQMCSLPSSSGTTGNPSAYLRPNAFMTSRLPSTPGSRPPSHLTPHLTHKHSARSLSLEAHDHLLGGQHVTARPSAPARGPQSSPDAADPGSSGPVWTDSIHYLCEIQSSWRPALYRQFQPRHTAPPTGRKGKTAAERGVTEHKD